VFFLKLQLCSKKMIFLRLIEEKIRIGVVCASLFVEIKTVDAQELLKD
jgi:hypothetical protein